MDTLDLMRTFLAVVEQDGFTAAAQRLGRSKALVSKHIGDLESRLGVRLLHRTTRQIGLTETGKAYFERARQLIAEFDGLESSFKVEAEEPRGLLKVTAPQTLGDLALMDFIAAYHRRYPAIALEIVLSDRVVDLVAEGFDLALRMSALADSSLIARKLCETRVLLCASPAYLKEAGTPAHPSLLADFATIVDSNTSYREAWRYREGDRETSVKLRPIITVNGVTAVRELLLQGLGLGAIPEFAVANDVRSGRLVAILPEAFGYPKSFFAVYPNRLHLSLKVRSFIDFAIEWYGKSAVSTQRAAETGAAAS